MVPLKFRSAAAEQQCEAPVWKQVWFFYLFVEGVR